MNKQEALSISEFNNNNNNSDRILINKMDNHRLILYRLIIGAPKLGIDLNSIKIALKSHNIYLNTNTLKYHIGILIDYDLISRVYEGKGRGKCSFYKATERGVKIFEKFIDLIEYKLVTINEKQTTI